MPQFRSISHQLYNTPTWHMSVRKQAVTHMREEAEYFEAFLGEEFETYCDEMGQDGTWGDELTLVCKAKWPLFLMDAQPHKSRILGIIVCLQCPFLHDTVSSSRTCFLDGILLT